LWGAQGALHQDHLAHRPGNGLAQFQTGQISYVGLAQGNLQVALRTMPKDIVKASSYDVWYLTFNTFTKPFDDLRVRRAFNLALDRQTLANDVLKGTAIPNYTLLMSGGARRERGSAPFPLSP
jgi:ABC-type oligopeptide transport system substrate-binding subunit